MIILVNWRRWVRFHKYRIESSKNRPQKMLSANRNTIEYSSENAAILAATFYCFVEALIAFKITLVSLFCSSFPSRSEIREVSLIES